MPLPADDRGQLPAHRAAARASQAGDPGNGFAYRRLDPPEFAALVGAARAWGVTVNDLLLAILLRALEPFAGRARAGASAGTSSPSRRSSISGAISATTPTSTFGQFLSSFRVSHPLPPGIALEQLARDIHAETARIKEREALPAESAGDRR